MALSFTVTNTSKKDDAILYARATAQKKMPKTFNLPKSGTTTVPAGQKVALSITPAQKSPLGEVFVWPSDAKAGDDYDAGVLFDASTPNGKLIDSQDGAEFGVDWDVGTMSLQIGDVGDNGKKSKWLKELEKIWKKYRNYIIGGGVAIILLIILLIVLGYMHRHKLATMLPAV